jgi:hypothetical protein
MIGVVLLGLSAFPAAMAGAASAGSVRSGPGAASVDGGTAQFGPGQVVGTSFSVTACGFAHGTAVTVSVDGTTAAATNAESTGCTTFGVVVSDPHLTVNGGPAVAVDRGANDIVSTGMSSSGGTQTDTYTFRVMPTPPAASLGAFSGADVMSDGLDVLAVLALGFLALTFARRRLTVARTRPRAT